MSESEIVSVPRWEKLRREGEQSAPRFSVRHLFVLITFAAAHMALLRTIAADAFGGTAVVVVVAQSMLLGLAFTGAFELFWRSISKSNWRVEPGHWLLAAIGIAAFFQSLAALANHVLPRDAFAALGIYSTALGLMLLPMVLARQTPLIWKLFAVAQLFFVWQNMLLMMPLIHSETSTSISVVIGRCEPPATLLMIAVACLVDPERKQRRWLHWCGVAVWVCSRSIPALFSWFGL